MLFALFVLAAGWNDFTRPGYTADEEFTEFAVRGITAGGLPLLPSGLLYDRGLAYSYAAALARALGGDGLMPPRTLSLLCASLALVALWSAVRQTADRTAAWIAVALVATSMPFWVVATTARFYAPFLASYLAALAVLAGVARVGISLPAVAALVLLSALCRLTHELAFTLAVIPALCALVARAGTRAKWLLAALGIAAGLALAQVGIFLLHFAAPRSGSTMIKRFFLWQVLNLFERPPLAAPLGLVLIAGLVALLLRPSTGSAPFEKIATLWKTGARIWIGVLVVVSAWAVMSGFERAFAYPLDLFAHLVRTMPLVVVMAVGLLIARALGAGGRWSAGERTAHLLWLGWVLFFGVIDSGITINYLLAPVTLMLTAIAIDLAAMVRRFSGMRIAAALVVAAIVGVTWGPRPTMTLAAARPTIAPPDTAQLRREAAAAPLVACTDELACLLLAGRVDRWLALDDFLRERFVVTSAAGQVGVYAGTPVATRFADLFDTPGAPRRVLIIDVFKELPVGSSATFVPRQLAAEGLSATPLIETPQLRVLELHAPIAGHR